MAAPMLRQAVTPLLTGQVDWKAEYAYTAGMQAFIYGFPYIYNAQIRHDWVTKERDPAVVPYAAVNHFWHAERLLDATYRDGGCPNNDTLYSLAWLDLSKEPLILSHPDMGDRYFTFEVMAFTSDNVDYVGQRTTGSDAGDFAIIGPGWKGRARGGSRGCALSHPLGPRAGPYPRRRSRGSGQRARPSAAVPPHPTQQAGKAERPAAGEARRLCPRRAGPRTRSAREDAQRDAGGEPPSRSPRVGARPVRSHRHRPRPRVEAQPEVVKQGLTRAAAIGMALLRQQFLSGDWATLVNGWRYPPPEEGRFGDDFLQRAADQSLAGITANDPAESVYLVNFNDADGNKFAPDGRYELHFSADNLPPVDAFWSMAAYTAADLNLIPNSVNRYSIGDRTAGLRRDADGGLTLHLQPDSPGQGKEANWLPTHPEQAWFLILRMYRPQPAVLAATWRCPGVSRLS